MSDFKYVKNLIDNNQLPPIEDNKMIYLTSSDYNDNWVKEKLEIIFDEQQKEKIKTIMAKEELDYFTLGADTSSTYTFTQEEIDTLFEMLCRVKDKNANEYSVYCKVREYFEER